MASAAAIKKQRRIAILATTIGSGLEWYEFALYAYLAHILSHVFFPPASDLGSTVSTMLIFAIGFLARPIGGLVFGYIGDKYGRKNALFYSIVLITAPTFIIGLLPTYAQIGIWAPILLALMRFLQGFPAGGEFPGSICYLVESAAPNQRGYMGSWTFFGSQLGSIFSMVEALLLEHFLPEGAFAEWGWRLSFLFGGVIGLAGCFLRAHLRETSYFHKVESHHHVSSGPILAALKTHKRVLIDGFFIAMLTLAGYYMLFVFSPIYLQQVIGVSHFASLMINGALLAFSTLLLPFFGKIGDKYGSKKLMIYTAFGILLCSPFLYVSSSVDALPRMLVFQTIAVFLITFHFSLLPKALAELFPTTLRYTCVALSYNISNMFVGGSAPAIALYLIQKTTNSAMPALIMVGAALASLLAIHFQKHRSSL